MLSTRYTGDLLTSVASQTDTTWWIKVHQESGKMHGFYTAFPFPASPTLPAKQVSSPAALGV